jgi:hypothetical protein
MGICKYRLASAVRSEDSILPSEIVLEESGVAIAEYEGVPLLRYDSLGALLHRYGLRPEELVPHDGSS